MKEISMPDTAPGEIKYLNNIDTLIENE
jgi:hypothetical protein